MINKIEEQIELLSGYCEDASEDFNNGYNIALEKLLSYIEELEKSKKINKMINKIEEQIELLSGYHEDASEDFNNGYNIALEELLSYIEELEKSKKIF